MGFWAHLDREAVFERGDVYRVGFDAERAAHAPVRLAVLGAGGVAQSKYLPALAQLRTRWEPVELVALSTLDARGAEKLSSLWGVPAYADSAALLREHAPDAVLVTSSDDAHEELTLAALESGAHVLVEKPIAASLEQAAAMCRAAEAAGRTLVTTCNKRYSPPYVEAHRLLDTGAVPRPALFSAKSCPGTLGIDESENGNVKFLGQLHQAQCLAVALRMRHSEVSLQLLLRVATALMANDHHRVVIEARPTANDSSVITKGAITMQLDKICKSEPDIVGGEGAL